MTFSEKFIVKFSPDGRELGRIKFSDATIFGDGNGVLLPDEFLLPDEPHYLLVRDEVIGV